MRAFAVLMIVVLGACTHPPAAEPATAPASGHKGSVTGPGPATTAKPTGVKPPAKPGDPVLPDIGCPVTSCAFHPGGGVYLTCLAGGAGVCFHYGAACTPPEGCMFDPADRTYKTCKSAVEGTCAAWAGATCAPTTKCMVDPATGIYRHCDSPTNGRCPSYGAVCAP